MSQIETSAINAPSYWASYLVNGDSSGLEESEIRDCDQWLSELSPWQVACPEGESFFGEFYFPYTQETLGCDLLEYPIYRDK